MRKLITFLLALVMLLSVTACSGNEYAGVWERRTYKSSENYSVSGSLTLNFDKSFIEERVTDKTSAVLEGTWEAKGSEIILSYTKLTSGEDSHFDEDGNLLNGVGYSFSCEIIDNALVNDETQFHKSN